eukprot:TRINITY_DN2_c0_g3_i1.p1 TRINITY_DN2_c0_g3~~TRINITY_DN2_c0_g3_i1.p1  ORF type:complete len:217 (-),score=-31.75 TRINITY_DN2_c0_g3_i1:451-1101(-)
MQKVRRAGPSAGEPAGTANQQRYSNPTLVVREHVGGNALRTSTVTPGHPARPLRLIARIGFQASVALPFPGSFHLSLTVLVRYRSLRNTQGGEGGPPCATRGSSLHATYAQASHLGVDKRGRGPPTRGSSGSLASLLAWGPATIKYHSRNSASNARASYRAITFFGQIFQPVPLTHRKFRVCVLTSLPRAFTWTLEPSYGYACPCSGRSRPCTRVY